MLPIGAVIARLPPSRQPRMPWNRVNSLIDGVYGFSATLLMLKLAAPAYEEGQLGRELWEQVPAYLVILLGFFQIIGAWSVMRRVSSWCESIDFYGMLLALLGLVAWATTPFTIDVMSSAVDNAVDFESSVRMLAAVVLVSMIGFSGLFARLDRGGFFRPGLEPGVFAVARFASVTAWVWPLVTFAFSYLIGGWAALFLVVLSVLTLIPMDAMSTEQYAEAD